MHTIRFLTLCNGDTLQSILSSDLIKRVHEHKQGNVPGFTKSYGCNLLVYYEQCDSMAGAIEREKQIKGGSRKKKLALIESLNPDWQDLYKSLL